MEDSEIFKKYDEVIERTPNLGKILKQFGIDKKTYAQASEQLKSKLISVVTLSNKTC